MLDKKRASECRDKMLAFCHDRTQPADAFCVNPVFWPFFRRLGVADVAVYFGKFPVRIFPKTFEQPCLFFYFVLYDILPHLFFKGERGI